MNIAVKDNKFRTTTRLVMQIAFKKWSLTNISEPLKASVSTLDLTKYDTKWVVYKYE